MTSYDHRKQPGHTVLVLNHQAPGHAVAPGTCLEAMASCAMPCHAMRCREAPAMKCETKARERSERPWRPWSFAETGSHLNPVSTCFNPMVSREDKLGIWCQDSPKNVVLRINPGFIALFGQLRSQVCLCPRHGISTSRHLARLANGRNMSKYSKWKRSILQPLAWPCLVTASSQGSQGSHFRGRKSQNGCTASHTLCIKDLPGTGGIQRQGHPWTIKCVTFTAPFPNFPADRTRQGFLETAWQLMDCVDLCGSPDTPFVGLRCSRLAMASNKGLQTKLVSSGVSRSGIVQHVPSQRGLISKQWADEILNSV